LLLHVPFKPGITWGTFQILLFSSFVSSLGMGWLYINDYNSHNSYFLKWNKTKQSWHLFENRVLQNLQPACSFNNLGDGKSNFEGYLQFSFQDATEQWLRFYNQNLFCNWIILNYYWKLFAQSYYFNMYSMYHNPIISFSKKLGFLNILLFNFFLSELDHFIF